MKTKVCEDCQESRPITEFAKNGTTPLGKQKRKPRCGKCQHLWQQRKFEQNVIAILGEGNYRCWECGYDRLFANLDFHHLDPAQKDYPVSSMRAFNFNKLKSEIDKCIVLCRICHTEVHYGLIDINSLPYQPNA